MTSIQQIGHQKRSFFYVFFLFLSLAQAK